MDTRTKEKYEQIRSLASRDWLKPATVSLAKLDQVKANVYNLGIADPKQLKATSDNLVVRQTGPSAEPPLSSLGQQRHVWGSNSSIPDLMRQQNEKKKLTRPWSAQNSSVQMKVVLKKPRPHSAKDSTNKPPRPTSAKKPKKTSIAVKGAHYEAAERPAGGIPCHTGSGWTAPPGGIHSEHAIEMVTQGQSSIDYKGCVSGGLFDMPPPVPPRGSPDFSHFLDEDHGGQRINRAVGELVHDLLDDTRKPSPREPIHLTLPSALQDEEEEEEAYSDKEYFNDVIEDIDDWIEEKKKYNSEQLNIDQILNGFEERIEIGSISSKLLKTDIGGSAEDLCKDLESSDSSSEEDHEKIEVGKKKKNVHVTFDEEKNKTRTITPRDDEYATVVPVHTVERNNPKQTAKDENKLKPLHATPDLKSINGRISSGSRPHSSGKRIERKPKNPFLNSTNTEKPLSPGRPHVSKYTAPVSTISVTYLEDEDNLNDSRKVSARRRNKRQGEIETVISQLSDSDSEPEEDGRPESRTRTVSSNYSRNYYQTGLSEHKPKVLTRKTLELGDGSVIERKSVFLLDSHRQSNRSYVVPMENRPKVVPANNRPKPPAKTNYSPSKPETVDHQVAALIESTKHLSMQDKRLENETKHEDHARPTSEMSLSGSAKRVEGSKPKKEVTFADSPTVGSHDCRSATPSSVPPRSPARRAPPSTYKLPVKKTAPKKEEDERVKFPKPLSLVQKRIEEDRQRRILDKTPQIITKHRDYEVEDSDGVKECRGMQDYLLDNGVPVTLETLYRALLPPTQYPVPQVSMVTNTSKPFPRHTAGLVSEPCYWLPEEHKRLQQAKKLVRQANLSLRYQELEEEREALRSAGITPTKKKKKRSAKKQKSIAGYKPPPKRTQSAPSSEQTQIAKKRNKSAPPGGRRKQVEGRDGEPTGDHISLNDLV